MQSKQPNVKRAFFRTNRMRQIYQRNNAISPVIFD